jgi:hypothetical protein
VVVLVDALGEAKVALVELRGARAVSNSQRDVVEARPAQVA